MGAPFVWFDLTTSGDGNGVHDFYTQLFGWTVGPGVGNYQGWVTDGEQPWAGILPADAASAGRWIPYVVVDDLDAAAKQAIALGGSVVRGKTVGPAGTSIVVTDPGGAAVALFTPARKPTQPMTGEELFWDLVEPMYTNPAVQRSTMMGLPCVRLDGRFFASLDRRTHALLVKLPQERVGELIAEGVGEPFAPAGRVFREWVAIPKPDRERWQRLLTEARDHAGPSAPGTSPVKPVDTTIFSGFSAAGLAFLAGLERDNTKRYFDTHRRTYQQELLEPSKTFVVALGAELRSRVSERLHAEPRIGGSLFRIANDLRFAKDKPPYKPHLDLAFWQGDHGPRSDPSLILRITPAEIHLGAGVFASTSAALDRYRTALRAPALVAELDTAVTMLIAAGAALSEPTRARPPSGFNPAEPGARFAVRDGFHVTQRIPHPAAITTAQFVAWCADQLTPFGPVHQWLARHAGTSA